MAEGSSALYVNWRTGTPEQIPSSGIAPGAVTTTALADGAVTYPKLSATVTADITVAKVGNVAFEFGGGTLVVTASQACDWRAPFNGTITKMTLLLNTTSSCVIDILKDTYVNYPPTTSITGGNPPTISGTNKTEDATLTGWTTAFTKGDCFRANVNSNTLATRCTLIIDIVKVA